MGKNQKWQLASIIAIAILTLYNILPTLFYYLNPLQEPINKKDAEKIAVTIEERINSQETESIDWIHSFCKTIQVSPNKISLDPKDPEWITIDFQSKEEASRFALTVQRSGALIGFEPAKLFLGPSQEKPTRVLLQRLIPIHFDQHLFTYITKDSPEYVETVINRAREIVHQISQSTLKKDVIEAILRQERQFDVAEISPCFSKLILDIDKEKIFLVLKDSFQGSNKTAKQNEILVQEVSRITQKCSETLKPFHDRVEIPIQSLEKASSFLCLNLEKLSQDYVNQVINDIKVRWNPQHPDLQSITITDAKNYESLSTIEKNLCLIIGSGFDLQTNQLKPDSIYIFAKGIQNLVNTYQNHPESKIAETASSDIRSLLTLLQKLGFTSFANANKTENKLFKADLELEKPQFYDQLLNASREQFSIQGDKKLAILSLSTKEHRAIVENKIDTKIHQELIKWRDDYLSSQVSLNPITRFDTPKPTHNVFWNNLKLTLKKLIRGDDQKILRWGLDLSGGKSVEIELRDGNHNIVSSDADLKQGMNELYNRVNKMGLSEVSLRKVGEHVVLDFPGSQSLSATDLIKASSMYFHVVNEKFSPHNSSIGEVANRFLQRVWDEAVFKGKTDGRSIQQIAFTHLYDGEQSKSIKEDAKILLENGLQLTEIGQSQYSDKVNDSESKVAIQRGSSPLDWQGMTHPLMFVFNSHVLEGSNLENIYASYDPSSGNYLSFSVASSLKSKESSDINPQNILYAWTSKYSKEAVIGTQLENYSHGRGWRMAVLLNDTVISSPNLDSSLKEGGKISGKFSQSEVQHLCADLKAGSLTFTPHILSEKNVSPELGQSDRTKGILATIIALAIVIVSMISYYRFAGLVASCAVVFNLLIMWAVLQNLGAALTLAGIAGIILTVGMSIDANVLVFERIREEFEITNRIESAIKAGYKKAFSAILDSNVTTIIAALILLNFDAGPIKSFATNLFIGIVSSMFTALFVTRFYFSIWAKNPKNKILSMANWIQTSAYDFLSKTKPAFIIALSLICLGGACLNLKSSSILGLDFTGGYSLHIEVQKTKEGNYAQKIQNALCKAGASHKDFQIQELNPSNELRILLSRNMEEVSKPFYGLPLDVEISNEQFLFEKNPKLNWIVQSLEKNDIHLAKGSLEKLHLDWSSVSGQMSDSMKTNAIIGFLLSFVGIFIYLAFRFEYKFAAAALGCLVHDVLITFALMGILHYIGLPVQIDLITMAAVMTAVGYSLNDTIIIFDRIREEMVLHPKRKLHLLVNAALNSTLSRTVITSGSTLLVLLALLLLGGPSIFGFALVMTIGVVFGTLSSWFIAAPLMLFFHSKEEKTEIQIA